MGRTFKTGRWLISLGFCALLTTACTVPSSSRSSLRPPNRIRHGEPVPDWAGAPLSWNKVEAVQAWLTTEGPGAPSYWRIEGELVVSDGNVQYKDRAFEGIHVGPGIVQARMTSAQAGYTSVLEDPSASPAQRERARRGLELVDPNFSSIPVARETAGPSSVTRGEWGARSSNPTKMTRATGKWNRVTVHHSAMAHPTALSGSARDSAAAVREIQTAHMSNKGWGDIGYHFLIDPSGRVLQGRELKYQGAHAGGSNNVDNIGVCLIGNFQTERPTRQALAALDQLLDELRTNYRIPASAVKPHKSMAQTDCPGRHMMAWLGKYN